jgi:hypothetical protein
VFAGVDSHEDQLVAGVVDQLGRAMTSQSLAIVPPAMPASSPGALGVTV